MVIAIGQGAPRYKTFLKLYQSLQNKASYLFIHKYEDKHLSQKYFVSSKSKDFNS